MAQKKIPGRVWCNKNQITIWKNNSTECLECLNCRRGKGSTHPCGTVLKTHSERNKPLRCEKCEKGKTFSTRRSNEMCKLCKKCKPNHRVIMKCLRRSDTVCGSCELNYYKKTDVMGITTCERKQHNNAQIKPVTHMKSLPKTSSTPRLAPSNLTRTSPPSPAITDVVYEGTIIPTSNTIKVKDTQPPVVVNIVLPVACVIVPIIAVGFAILRWNKSKKRKKATSRAISRESNNNKESCAVEMEPLHSGEGHANKPPAAAGRQQQNVGEPSVHVELHSASSGLLVEQPTTTDHCRENNGVQTPQEVLSHTADQLDCTCQSANKAKIAGGTDKSCVGASPSISPQGHQDIDVDTCLSELQSKERFERMERSTKVSTYLLSNETYKGKAYGTMCHLVNALNKDQFTEVVCSLDFPPIELYYVYRESVGDFNKVLENLITKNPKLKLEDLAEVFEKKKHTTIASICREEDRRAQ